MSSPRTASCHLTNSWRATNFHERVCHQQNSWWTVSTYHTRVINSVKRYHDETETANKTVHEDRTWPDRTGPTDFSMIECFFRQNSPCVRSSKKYYCRWNCIWRRWHIVFVFFVCVFVYDSIVLRRNYIHFCYHFSWNPATRKSWVSLGNPPSLLSHPRCSCQQFIT